MTKSERGSVALEMVLLTPVLLCLLLFVVVAGRLVNVRNDVDFSAKAGARAASITRSSTLAGTEAQDAVNESLDNTAAKCSSLDTTVDTSGFKPGGQVTVTVRCAVDISMASLLHIPASKTVTATFTEPIDLYIGASS